jgi:hypothetical protein
LQCPIAYFHVNIFENLICALNLENLNNLRKKEANREPPKKANRESQKKSKSGTTRKKQIGNQSFRSQSFRGSALGMRMLLRALLV